jgi:hypothetical protein
VEEDSSEGCAPLTTSSNCCKNCALES